MPKTVAIIPARYASTRFPGKPLAELWGKPLIQHVYERTCSAKSVSRVIIATDDERIATAAHKFGAEAAMTRADHPSGADRVAEVAAGLDADLIVNVQGDEPLIEPEAIDAAISPFHAEWIASACLPRRVVPLVRRPCGGLTKPFPMATLAAPVEEVADLANPNIVKVVVDQAGFALYFSRLPIPFVRDSQSGVIRYRHLGLYVYRRDFLLSFAALAPTPLEQAEKLEQLRALEHGYPIKVVIVDHAWTGVDTPEDLERLKATKLQ